MKVGCEYYVHEIGTVNGTKQVTSRTQDGRIRVMEKEMVPLNFDVDKSELSPHDRYRSRITLSIERGQAEE